MLVWVAILLLSHLMCFSPLKNIFSTSSIASRQIPLLSRFLGLTSTASQQIGRSIKPKSCALCLLNTSSTDSRSIEVSGLHLDRFFNLSRSFCMHFFFLCFAFFSFCAHNILFSFSCRSMVPCSPRALYVSFLFVSSQFFGFLGPLTIVSKRGRNLRIECHSSRGVINLGENFMLKGRNFLI